MNTKHITFLIFCFSMLFMSCKKDSGMDPLSDVVFSKNGVIRIECSDCALNYSVQKDSHDVNITESEDISFTYVSDVKLTTTINSRKKQNIRLAVFDAYGRIVSNELTSFNQGDSKIATFSIKIN